MKIETIKDALIIASMSGACLIGASRLISTIGKVPEHETRLERLESKMGFVVSGIEQLTGKKYRKDH